jgi:hypothetical protein
MTLALILAGWGALAVVVVACVWRFGTFLDGQSDPDRRTRWNREAPVHDQNLAGQPGANHGEK